MFGAPDRDARGDDWQPSGRRPFSTGLTPAETERLAILAEECGEVMQIVAKILRHGFESYHPADAARTTNRRLLENEVGDISNAVHMLMDAGDLNEEAIIRRRREKAEKIKPYLHHQPEGSRP